MARKIQIHYLDHGKVHILNFLGWDEFADWLLRRCNSNCITSIIYMEFISG